MYTTLRLQVPLVDLSVFIYCLLRDKLDYSNSMTGCYCEILRSCALCGHEFGFLAYYAFTDFTVCVIECTVALIFQFSDNTDLG